MTAPADVHTDVHTDVLPDVPVPSAHRLRLGEAVRGARRERSLTLRQLAVLVGVSAATLSGIENGRIGVSTERLDALARALDVGTVRLLEGPDATASPAARSLPQADDGLDWRAYAALGLDPALGGALSSFVEYGYHGATMRIVAERAGLSVPGLYHHYASKQEMLVALLDLTMDDLHARTAAALAEAEAGAHGPCQRLALVVECLALFHTHRRELGFIGASEMRSLEPEARERVTAMRVAEQRIVDAEVEAGVRAGTFTTPMPHQAARALTTMCTGLAQWFRTDGPHRAEEVAAQYVVLALDLVGCTEARPVDVGRPRVPGSGGAPGTASGRTAR